MLWCFLFCYYKAVLINARWCVALELLCGSFVRSLHKWLFPGLNARRMGSAAPTTKLLRTKRKSRTRCHRSPLTTSPKQPRSTRPRCKTRSRRKLPSWMRSSSDSSICKRLSHQRPVVAPPPKKQRPRTRLRSNLSTLRNFMASSEANSCCALFVICASCSTKSHTNNYLCELILLYCWGHFRFSMFNVERTTDTRGESPAVLVTTGISKWVVGRLG